MSVQRFDLAFAEGGLLPTVEISVQEQRGWGDVPTERVVVKRVRSYRADRAMLKALRWARGHGDPR